MKVDDDMQGEMGDKLLLRHRHPSRHPPSFSRLPCRVAGQFSKVAHDGHVADNDVVEDEREREKENTPSVCEMGTVTLSDCHDYRKASQVEEKRPHGNGESTKVFKESVEAFLGKSGAEGRDENPEELRVDVVVELSIGEKLE